MSIGSLGIVGGVAGSPLSQVKGDAERAREATAAQERRADADLKADDAAGIGRTDGDDHETGERDADGRRLYETPPTPSRKPDDAVAGETHGPKDPTGQSGSQLDLTG